MTHDAVLRIGKSSERFSTRACDGLSAGECPAKRRNDQGAGSASGRTRGGWIQSPSAEWRGESEKRRHLRALGTHNADSPGVAGGFADAAGFSEQHRKTMNYTTKTNPLAIGRVIGAAACLGASCS